MKQTESQTDNQTLADMDRAFVPLFQRVNNSKLLQARRTLAMEIARIKEAKDEAAGNNGETAAPNGNVK